MYTNSKDYVSSAFKLSQFVTSNPFCPKLLLAWNLIVILKYKIGHRSTTSNFVSYSGKWTDIHGGKRYHWHSDDDKENIVYLVNFKLISIKQFPYIVIVYKESNT